jgi:uncharacterized cupin superfamily protein
VGQAWVIDPVDAEESDHYPAPTTKVEGSSRGRFSNPDAFPLWFVVGELEAGSELSWAAGHGDEVVYVAEGELEVDGLRCDSGGVVIVESDVATTVRAKERTAVVHFGPVSFEPPGDGPLGPPSPDGHGVHVRDEHSLPRKNFYADSDCPTCRLTLMRNVHGPLHTTASHTHSTDEIIYMLSGDIQFGSSRVTPGMALAIPGDYRYRFRSQTGCEFLNYRRDASLYTTNPKEAPLLETVKGLKDRRPSTG